MSTFHENFMVYEGTRLRLSRPDFEILGTTTPMYTVGRYLKPIPVVQGLVSDFRMVGTTAAW